MQFPFLRYEDKNRKYAVVEIRFLPLQTKAFFNQPNANLIFRPQQTLSSTFEKQLENKVFDKS